MGDYKQFKHTDCIENRYSLGKTLGQGAFGLVRMCIHKDTGKNFAIKIMKKSAIKKQEVYVKLLKNELEILGE